ncbi:Signal recognition particle SEC65 subunit [Smittium culicis]|uniref:Signal recognition particle SEC65 subunit n=1 Tax=Smittium culicis TaxID=133412 RepID=A0A1R1WXN1_9FUNG|nr:Signal recognition particle SEC65 subunit [Smittium culicis]
MSSRIEEVNDMDFPLPEPPSHSGYDDFFPTYPSGVEKSFEKLEISSKKLKTNISGIGQYSHVDDSESKNWVCLYPIYFDYDIPREKGRKVPKDSSVKKPHVRQIYEAAKSFGLRTVYQPQKSHPRSFFNPGRVKIELKSETGELLNREIANRKILMNKLGKILPSINVEREKEAVYDDFMSMKKPGLQATITESHDIPVTAPAKASSSTEKTKKSKNKQKKGKGQRVIV